MGQDFLIDDRMSIKNFALFFRDLKSKNKFSNKGSTTYKWFPKYRYNTSEKEQPSNHLVASGEKLTAVAPFSTRHDTTRQNGINH